jgi:NAD(P)-dependent dehydrogenase (short-subunit alcohol dehydrogenase family)
MDKPDLPDLFSLDGRVALVTGAGHPAGSSIAIALAAAGAQIVAVDLGDASVAAATMIRDETGQKVEAVSCDFADRDDLERCTDLVLQKYPKIDVLFNAAYEFAAEYTSHAVNTDLRGWDICWANNVIGPVHFCQAIGRRMVRDGGGVIINLLSSVSFEPYVGLSYYCASKAAEWMFTRCLALECAPTVRVHGLATGSLAEVRDNPEQLENRFIPLRRYGATSELAGAAVYLASDAASFSTGDVVFVDGGVAPISAYPTANLSNLPA